MYSIIHVFWSSRRVVANQGSWSVNKLYSLVALACCVSSRTGSTLDTLFHLVLTQSNQGSTHLENLTAQEIKAEK